ncbi:MAG TPA: methylenetetrahydrofolate reductase [NAD(P)H] [Alphaproteobacteria bacterium]|nr:methylenetetrahydrofolate reductase [NAD(P)H] [Alphaproteobacteria bacterium]
MTEPAIVSLPHLEALGRGDIRVSFEFFPPKTEAMEAQLWEAVNKLAPVRPTFISVTYGAGGSTRERTHAVVSRIQNELHVPSAAHLTCVNATRDEIDRIADAYWQAGIRHIVALRGDPPGGIGGVYQPTPGGYAYANELVEGLLKLHPFEISVAAYPECHPQAASPAADIDALKRKIDSGATRAITNFFFDTDCYSRFLDRVSKAGISVPIVPGILPLINYAKAAETVLGVPVPNWIRRVFSGLDGDLGTRQLMATMIAVEQCRALYGLGVRQFHFYTMNRAELVLGICHLLGVRVKA